MRPAPSNLSRSDFSIARAIAHLADPQLSDITSHLPDDVIEASRATEHGFSAPAGPGNAIVVPLGYFARDLSLGTATAGGNLVASPKSTALDALRGHSVVVDAGVSVVEVPIGNVPGVPFVSADPVASWASAEGAGVAESAPAFGLATPTMKTVGLHFTVTRKLLSALTPGN